MFHWGWMCLWRSARKYLDVPLAQCQEALGALVVCSNRIERLMQNHCRNVYVCVQFSLGIFACGWFCKWSPWWTNKIILTFNTSLILAWEAVWNVQSTEIFRDCQRFFTQAFAELCFANARPPVLIYINFVCMVLEGACVPTGWNFDFVFWFQSFRVQPGTKPGSQPTPSHSPGFISDVPIQFDIISPGDETKTFLGNGKAGPPK